MPILNDIPVELLFLIYDKLPIEDIIRRVRCISTAQQDAVQEWLHLCVIKSFVENDSFLIIHIPTGGSGRTYNASVHTFSNNGTTIHLPPIRAHQNDFVIHDIGFFSLDIGFINGYWDTARGIPDKDPPEAYNEIKIKKQYGRKLELEAIGEYHGVPLGRAVFRKRIPIYFDFEHDPTYTPPGHWTLMEMKIYTRDLFRFCVNWR